VGTADTPKSLTGRVNAAFRRRLRIPMIPRRDTDMITRTIPI
jgi:hypothetical protein